MKILSLLVLVMALSGCLTKSKSSFMSVSSNSYFVLEANVYHKTKVAIGLGQGKYTAIFQDADFVYYYGPSKGLLMNEKIGVNGGIALPKPTSKRNCNFFIEIGDDSESLKKNGVLMQKLSKMEAGRIRTFGLDNDPQCQEYLADIKIVQEQFQLKPRNFI